MWHRFRDLQQGEFFVVFADPAGDGADYCAVQFLSAKWLDVPIVYHSKVTGSYMTPLVHEELTAVSKKTGVPPIVAFERNAGGEFLLDQLSQLNRYGAYRIYTMKNADPTGRVVDTGKMGWSTNNATRPKMLRDLKDAIEHRQLHIYHRATVDEMYSFVVKPTGKAQAENDSHDDLFMALAGAWQLYQTEKPQLEDSGSGVIETTRGHGFVKEAGVLYAGEDYA